MKRNKSPRPAANLTPAGISPNVLPIAVLIVITVFVYWNSLSGEFVFDDQQIILQNPLLLNIHSLADVAKLGLGWRQLLFLTYGLNYYWSGLDPYSYHAVNLFLHVLNVILVYFIVYEVAGKGREARYPAFTGAAVFAAHTLLSGAVSYISGRSSVLCALFYFLAVFLFLKGIDREAQPGTRAIYLVLTAVSGMLAWQAKQEAITLPVLLAALFWMRSEKKELRYIVVLAALPLIMAAVAWKQLQNLFETAMRNKVLVTAGFEAVLQPVDYFRTYVASIVTYYLPRFVIPADLSADPHILTVGHWYSPEFILSAGILAALVWLIFRPRKTDVLLRAGLAAIVFSPLAAYALVPLADVVLEHRAYIPGLGIALLSAALFRWASVHFQGVRIAGPAVIVILLSIMTIQRNAVFANSIAFWQDAAAKSPNKPRPHFNLGATYQNNQRFADAMREYQAALALKPDINAAYSNMAAIQIDSGQLDEAEKTLLKLTQLAPDYTEGFINLAVLYVREKQSDKALVAADRAIAINVEASAAYYNKAEALTQKGDFQAALPNYERAVYLRPDLPSFQLNLGAAYVHLGNFDGAEKTFLSMTNGPLAAEASRNLGSMYASVNQDDKAIDYLKRAVQLRADYVDAHHDLGVLYMKKKLTDQAIEEFGATVRQQPDYGPGVLNLSLAYETKGDVAAARHVLESYMTQFGNSNSPYLQQVQNRLMGLRQGS